jgi:hypothetical protein
LKVLSADGKIRMTDVADTVEVSAIVAR